MALFSSGKKIVELNEEILSLQTEASKLKQLNEKLSLENKELRTENNSLVIEAETLRAQINNFMEKYTDVEELEKKAGTLRQEIDELTAAALNLPAESYENVPEQIKKEIEVLEDYKASLAKEIVEKENELENLKMQISSFKDISIESESIPVDNLQKLTAQQDTLQEIYC
jgi:GDP/GTP exchange factor Sec2p.